MMGADVKGDIYEGLLEKNAEDTKCGAGQHFTRRLLIRAMVKCVQPEPKSTIADPACGTGGFFLAAYDFIVANHGNMDKDERRFLKFNRFYGNEIVAGTRRLALMTLFLHNIGKNIVERRYALDINSAFGNLKKRSFYSIYIAIRCRLSFVLISTLYR